MESQFTHVHESPPPGDAPDWTCPQDWDAFTADEPAMWERLCVRQSAMMRGRGSECLRRGMDVLWLAKPGIPDGQDCNARSVAGAGGRGGGGRGGGTAGAVV